MKQELNIEVDEDNNVIGLRPREDFYGTGRIHRGVHLLLFNSDSKLLLQRRSENKKWYPRFFSFSAGGTVGDETTEECIKRETYEEIGIKDISFNELFTFHFSDKVNNSFETIFLSQSDSPVIIDKKEVESCKWVSIEELKKDLLKKVQKK